MEKKLLGIGLETGNELRHREEIELYKERLRQMEIAFRYNLSLLADRDAELDVLEEQLRNGIVQLERVSREKENCQQVLRLLDEKKTKEAKLLNDKLIEREKAIKELERRNDANLRTLKKALEDMKREQQQEKERAERMLIRVIQLKEAEHAKELTRIEKKHVEELDEVAQAKQKTQRANNEKGNSREEVEHAEEKWMRLHGRTGEKRGTSDTEETTTECRGVKDAATQTSNGNAAEVSMLREQNEVLKRIIKNLKGKIEKGRGECEKCRLLKQMIQETNARFDSEIIKLKRERTEEEAVIESLERSLSSLKEKVVKSLAAGENHLLVEHRLNRRLEKIDEKLEELTRKVDTGSSTITTRNVTATRKCGPC